MKSDFINSVCSFLAYYMLCYFDAKPNIKDDFIEFVKNYKEGN